MTLTIADFFEQVDGFSIEDAPPELRARINEELADLTNGITGPQGEPSTGPSPGDPDAVVVDNAGGGDFTSIQAAVDDPDTEPGNTILIRPGTYATGDKVEVTDPGELRLVGSGSGSDPSSNTVLKGQLEVLVEEAAGNGVTMRDLRMEGVADDGAAINATAAFGGSALREIGVENVAFVNNDFEGLDIQDPAEDLAVRDCLIENNGDNGIEGEDITNAVVSDCTIKNNGGEAIDFDAVDSLVIDRCTIRNNGESGIKCSSITDAEFRDTTVSNNGFESIGLFANNIETLVFEDLDVLSNGFEGIDLFGNDIGDIDVSNVTADDNGGIGIALGDAFDETVSEVSTVNIRDTSASGNKSEGVLLATERITEVTLTSVTTSSNGFEGIDLFANELANVTISRVTARDNDGAGVFIGNDNTDAADIDNLLIERSVVAGNGADFADGIAIAGDTTDGATITDSNIVNNVGDGVSKTGSGTVNVEDSFLNGNDAQSDGDVKIIGLRSDPVSKAGVNSN